MKTNQFRRIFTTLLVIFILAEGVGFYIAYADKRSTGAIQLATLRHKSQKRLDESNRELKRMIAALSPKGRYIVIDTAKNILYLNDGDRIVRQMTVSSGSGNILEDPSGEKTWVFDTPRGEFSIRSKKKNPVWIKPDWAFIEDGMDIPKNQKERIESGMLGDYALGFGNGYFIHGTLYTRLLGRNVTHGCIRVGDSDLEFLFRNTPLHTKLVLF